MDGHGSGDGKRPTDPQMFCRELIRLSVSRAEKPDNLAGRMKRNAEPGAGIASRLSRFPVGLVQSVQHQNSIRFSEYTEESRVF